jgi:phospholipase/carboxylesterase
MSELLPHITLQSGSDPQCSIIWLHGLGASGEDFVSMVDELHLPHAVRYIFPHAPERPVTINGGYIMPAWYDIRSSDIGAQPDVVGIRASQHAVEKLIAQEVQRGIASSNIFLAGFSQGGAIALHSGLRSKEKLGGILALSTYLPLANTLQAEATLAAKSTPIFMAHGLSDPVVPYALGKASAEELQRKGYVLDWREYAMQHTLCMEEVRDIEMWLQLRM